MASAASMAGPRFVSEPTRERETYKYDPSLLSSIRYNDTTLPVPSTELVTSSDTVLTALAQLGALRLNTARALISLFDQRYQYIVAEATPTMPLVPSLCHEERNEDLWLCGTAIPRVHGVCEYTLGINESMSSEDDSQTPLALVSDLTADARFCIKPYCRPGTAARFYAAVPIRTRRGINIGVLCLMDTKPRELSTWDESKTRFMQGLSSSIMEHLEYRRSSTIHSRNGQMMRGLGCFIEGKEALSAWNSDSADGFPLNDTMAWDKILPVNLDNSFSSSHEQALNFKSPTSDPFAQPTVVDGGPRTLTPARMSEEPGTQSSIPTPTRADQPHHRKRASTTSNSPLRQGTVEDVFARATNIARQALQVEGILALDASVGLFGTVNTVAVELQEELDNTLSQSPSGTSGSDSRPSGSDRDRFCKVLGFSASAHDNRDSHFVPPRPAEVPQKLLYRLLRRYPRGKVFNFDHLGEMQSSDSSEEELDRPASRTPLSPPGSPEASRRPSRRRSTWSRRAEGALIRQLFPGATNVAFVPIWDAKKDRWFAGGFTYTYATTRIFTTEQELNYLRAFGMLTMEESFRMETQLADKAKADVLNSLSHELRSPLHGILAASELLNDTSLDAFQGNLMHTLETCCRTLLDTVEHLLTFSKVNSYIGSLKLRKNSASLLGGHKSRSKAENPSKQLYSHFRLDVLVADVMESVFVGFNFQRASLSQLTKQRRKSLVDDDVNRKFDTMRALEDHGPGNMENGRLLLDHGKLSVYLDIDHTCSWIFLTQPGAIRRIVMNLFGNSLKYTRRGSIVVSITQDKSKSREKVQMVKITVADTGKGIGPEYLQHELFRPFSQEDPNSVGTGLGLSLVKQITTALKGHVSVNSRAGVGTSVSVSLPLWIGNEETASAGVSGDDHEFLQALAELQGRRIQLVGFRPPETHRSEDYREAGLAVFDELAMVKNTCKHWLKMEVIDATQTPYARPDLVLYNEDAYGEQSDTNTDMNAIPGVVICANVIGAFQRSGAVASSQPGRICEFVSQPTDPRKLAKTLSLALTRWKTQQAQVQQARSDPIVTQATLVLNTTSIAPPLPEGAQTTQSEDAMISITTVAFGQTSAPLPALSPPTSEAANSGKQVFLLVDDNPINVKILSSFMKKLGHPYATATNGLEAVEAFCDDPARFKCVFMDISMPVMDGFEATRRIRAHEREHGLARVPVFALSGLASNSAQQEASESGIDLFLTKPVKLKELGLVIATKMVM